MATANVNPVTNIRYGVGEINNYRDLADHIRDNGNDNAYDYFVSEIKASLGMLDDESDSEQVMAVLGDIYGGYNLASYVKDILEILSSPSNVIKINGLIEAYPVVDELWDLICDDVEYESDNDCQDYTLTDIDGTEYRLGSDLIWVFYSPTIVYVESLCSPCVPNAGDLDSGLTTQDLGYECYGIPENWL